MATILEHLQGLWSGAKSAPARTRAHFSIKEDHTDLPPGEDFAPGRHYFQIIINELFLANMREWFVEYEPMAFAASTYQYGNAVETSPTVVGPGMLRKFGQGVPEGMIFRDTPVTGLHPYQGNAFTLLLLLNKVERQNNVGKLLEVLEGIAGIADPVSPLLPFNSYLKIAGTVMEGVTTLFGLEETVPILGYQFTINPAVGTPLRPTYFVVLDRNENDVQRENFHVRESRLYHGPPDNLRPYRESDFILFRIAQGTQRTDERTLPFYPLWEKTRELAQQSSNDHFWQEAKAHFNTLKREMIASPDLTRPDYQRLKDEYLEEMKRLRLEAVNDSLLSAEAMNEMEREMQTMADELDQLDEL